MGARHLIAVIKDGQPKIAQYGQWDGYPDGQGVDVLAFAQSLASGYGAAEKFSAALDRCRFAADQAELERLWDDAHYRDRYLTRDLGSDILTHVFDAEGDVVLRNSYDFAADSLFCEWAYVIDLDQGSLEVYRGFQRGDAPEGERFHGATCEDANKDYGPVRLAKTYPLASLPSQQAFLADLCPEDEVEEAA